MVDTDWYKGTKISWICRPEKIFLSKKIASAPRRAPWKAGQPSQAPPAEGRAASTSVARGRLMRGRGGSVARLVRSRGVSVARLVRGRRGFCAQLHPGRRSSCDTVSSRGRGNRKIPARSKVRAGIPSIGCGGEGFSAEENALQAFPRGGDSANREGAEGFPRGGDSAKGKAPQAFRAAAIPPEGRP